LMRAYAQDRDPGPTGKTHLVRQQKRSPRTLPHAWPPRADCAARDGESAKFYTVDDRMKAISGMHSLNTYMTDQASPRTFHMFHMDLGPAVGSLLVCKVIIRPGGDLKRLTTLIILTALQGALVAHE
jgi:hypothetical protein